MVGIKQLLYSLFLELTKFVNKIIFILSPCTGGAPDIEILTGGEFTEGVVGCIADLILEAEGSEPFRVHLWDNAMESINVEPCPLQ